MKKSLFFVLSLVIPLLGGCCSTGSHKSESETVTPETISVLSFNVWQEGTHMENGFEYIADNIAKIQPDIVAFTELRNKKDTDFIARIIEALRQRGQVYYGHNSISTGVISRYPVKDLENLSSDENKGSATLSLIDIGNIPVAFYALQLDYRHSSSYLPRAYDSTDFKELPDGPVTDAQKLIDDSRASYRDEIVELIIKSANSKRDEGKEVFICGNFNEPSHLDWQDNTKNLYEHSGVVINWENSKAFEREGYLDSYREIYPNPVTHPGFTFPADNPAVEMKELAKAPKADERDRIDFIYYSPGKYVRKAQNTYLVAPHSDIVRGERTAYTGQDPFIEPVNGWPTDHRAVLTVFEVEKHHK